MTIATEIGVFHDLAPMCISAMREVMFGGEEPSLDDTDDEYERAHRVSNELFFHNSQERRVYFSKFTIY